MSLDNFNIPVEILEKMSLEEEEMRRSEWYINECNRCKNITNGWIALTEEGQQKIVSKYFPNNDFYQEIALRQLRKAHHIYPENQIFRNRLQVRYNRARKGELKNGDNVPEFISPYLKDGVNMFVGSSMT
jgi:hypothetical protein